MVGTTLSQYHIDAEIGRGGMGIVYKATDKNLNRTVAIKVLPPAALGNEDDRARFFREAQAAAQLSHPNVCHVYQVDEAVPTNDGEEPQPGAEKRLFIAMEFIEGQTLYDYVKKGPLKLTEAVRVAIQVADALKAAHAKEIVHRDIKSANVMLAEDGTAKVLDFGLAKTNQSTMLTKMGSTLGTIAYMSPEQARGQEVDSRTDLYSLGTMLYEMIAGRPPFAGEYEQAVVYSILNEDPEPLTSLRTGVPMQLEWIVNKCMAKDAEERYQSAKGLLVDLKAVDLKGSGHTTSTNISLGTAGPMSAGPLSGAAMSGESMSGGMVPGTAPTSAVQPATGTARRFIIPVLVAAGVALLALGYLASILLGPAAEAPKINRAHLIPAVSGNINSPALSPDGQILAFSGVDSVDGISKLYLYNFETGQTSKVRNADSPEVPRFSEDGSRIAFRSGGDLKIVPSTGGDAISIVSGATFAVAWGSDRTVFYTDNTTIFQISEGGGEAVKIVSIDTSMAEEAIVPVQLLPGTSQLLIGVYKKGAVGSLQAFDLSNGERKTIIEPPFWWGAYSSTGHLLYMPDDTELRVRPFDINRLSFTGPPVTLYQNITGDSWHLSSSGSFIRNPNTGTGRKQYSFMSFNNEETLIRSDEMDYEEFRISPSGKFIASEVNQFQGEGDQIILFEVEIGSIRPLTQSFQHFDPAWSPDELRIVSGGFKEGKQGLFVSNTDGSGSEEVLWEAPNGTGSVHQLDWSPNSDFLAFKLTGEKAFDIWLYSFADSSVSPLIEDPKNQEFPRFSRNGKYIAYQSNELGKADIFVKSVDGKSKWPVTTSGGSEPVWSVSGDEIFYRVGGIVYGISVETEPVFRVAGQPRKIFDAGSPIRFDVHPDGEGFVISRSGVESAGHFEIIYNFSEYLKQVAPPTQ